MLGAVFFALPRAARASITPSTSFSTAVAQNDSNVIFYIGSSTIAGPLNSMSVWLGDETGGSVITVQLRVTCFADDTTTSQTGCTSASAFSSNILNVYNSFGQEYFFTWSSPISLQVGKYYTLEILSTGGNQAVVYGATTLQWANQCNWAGLGSNCTGTPYFTLNASPDWSGLNATSTALTSLYQAGASSTLSVIQQRCSGSGNIFGDAICAAFVFVFVPDPQILNQFAALPTTEADHWPFSWVAGVTTAFDALSASSTSNLPTYSMNLASVDPASTTPLGPILPSFTFFSSSTVLQYIGQSNWNALMAIMTAVLYMLLVYDIFFTLRNRFHRV